MARGPGPAQVLERIRQLKEQAQQQQLYDGGAWEQVVQDLKALNVVGDETRAAFEALLDFMPSASSVWARYIELEMSPTRVPDEVKPLFSRCLLNCPTVELHLLYLKFIKRMNDGKGMQGLLELRQAYEFSLELVGQDLTAGPLWTEYLEFLQAPKPGSEAFSALFPDALQGQEEAARTPVIRRVYQRAVLVPCNMIEGLWRSYETWEGKLDKQLGRKMLDEWRPRYQQARNVQRERRRKLERIHMGMLPLPPVPEGLPLEQVDLWQQYIDYELSNPQRLENDSPLLANRISLAYGQAITVLRHCPEVWLQYAGSQLSVLGEKAALAVMAKAVQALPGCGLLRLAQAELQERHGMLADAKQTYEAMVELLEREVPPAPSSSSSAAPDQPPESAPAPPAGEAQPSGFGGDQGTLLWMQYVRFLRRTTGAPSSRQAFLRAHRWHQRSISLAPLHPPEGAQDTPLEARRPPNGWQLYSSMARLEWLHDRTSPAVACRIYELGLEDPRLLRDPSFITSYASFLSEVGDVDNARALYERCLSESGSAALVELWRAYAVLEAQQGNLTASLQVEERMRKALSEAAEPGALPPGAPPPARPALATLQVAVCKFAQDDLLPCEPQLVRYLRMAAGLPGGAAGGGGWQGDDEGPGSQGGFGPGPRDRANGFSGPPGGPPRGWDRERERDRGGDWERGGGGGGRGGWGGSYRERERESSMERDGPGPLGRGRRGGPPLGPEEDLPPDMIEYLLNLLPPPTAVEGPLVPVDSVMDVVVYGDLSAAAMARVCADLDVGNVPSGEDGVAVPQIVGMAARGGLPPDDLHHGPPPPHHDGGPYYPPPGPGDPYEYDHPPPYHPYHHPHEPGRDPRDLPPPYADARGPPPPDYMPPPPEWYHERERYEGGRGPPPAPMAREPMTREPMTREPMSRKRRAGGWDDDRGGSYDDR